MRRIELRCIFCGWYEWENTSKGAEPFDVDKELTRLVTHLETVHTDRFLDFLRKVANK